MRYLLNKLALSVIIILSAAIYFPRANSTAGAANDSYGYSFAATGDIIVAGSYLGAIGANAHQGPLAPFASVSSASFAVAGGLAPESIVAGFGVNLATSAEAAQSIPLPTTLAGVSVRVTDSLGQQRLAPLFFVSPGQINYEMPAGTADGPVTVTVTNGDVPVASGTAQVFSVAPGLFSANSSGQGVAAAFVIRIKGDTGSQTNEPVAIFDSAQNRFVPIPIDLGPPTDLTYLVLYGTGLRHRSSLSAVNCLIGGVKSETLFAGPAPGFVGLDQIVVRLPRSLAGRGEVDVALSADGKAANTVSVSFR